MGQTNPQVRAAVADALGGTLFLDEAYALVQGGGPGGGGDSFSGEAVRTLLTEVENNRTNLMVVLAGYKDKMGKLMRADPGMARRFPLRLNLPDYSCAELAQICRKVVAERYDKQLEEGPSSRNPVFFSRLGLCAAHS